MKWILSLAIGALLTGIPSISGAQPAQPGPGATADDDIERAEESITARESKDEPGRQAINYFAERFSTFDPVYFSLGWRGGFHSKFQLSFKYQLFREDGAAATRMPVLDNFYFGYTQFSIWDLGKESAPFRDTNYKPGAFYEADFFRDRWQGLETVGWRAGFEHESNGRDEPDSRSLNVLYLRPRLVLGDADKFYFEVAPKAYTYVGNHSDNPDIADYRGYVDLNLKMGCGDGWQISSVLRRGTEKHYGSVQVDATYPMKDLRFLGDLGGFLHLQYFNGWGESLIDYNRKLSSQFRVGIMIVR